MIKTERREKTPLTGIGERCRLQVVKARCSEVMSGRASRDAAPWRRTGWRTPFVRCLPVAATAAIANLMVVSRDETHFVAAGAPILNASTGRYTRGAG